ncbi:drug resistance transporter, EmrB/QacA subfamily [Nocardia amikacinitolerans]|uniref:Drug resistance transporter, EmrB/QacA subfamily n=1 Tax=Nocardia amikacinitolerans TaxID=756689 RepID=A0A285LWN4_9NOCA|nr:MFS transporter [Nocardia amikacinitolerans]MCP2295497.1 drug resistance transporter, EmrB/QacA subfamily [Nocardia amikacinitolerans]SNY88066.1 drug resistance transporter, EmrB/QacA subfamily [Nocardia amikacinitolerans]
MSEISTAVHAPDDRRDSARWLALGVIGLAQLMVVLDATIVTIALPFAQRDLGISEGDKQWALTAYTLIFGGLLLLGGRLADYLGRRRIFLVGLIGFAAASALAGLAQNGAQLFAGRGLQGAFAALLAPAALALVSVTFTEAKERARAFAVFAGISAGGAAIGLIAGGALTEYASWRWTLLVNTPIAILAFVGALAFVIKDVPAPRTGGYDVPGAVTVTAGLIAIVYGFSRAADHGWTSGGTLALLVAGLALLVAFVVIERRSSNPLLPLRIPGESNRGGALLAALLIPIAMFAMFLFLSFYFQVTLGYSPLKAGVAFLPFPVGIAVSAGVTSALLPKLGPRPLMVAGAALGVVGLLWLAQLSYGDSYAAGVLPAQLLIALGMGPLFVGMQAVALHRVDEADAGVASALLNAAQQVGGAVGTALLTTISVQAAKDYLADNPTVDDLAARAAIHSYDVAFYVGAGFFLAAIPVIALMIKAGPADFAEDAEEGVRVPLAV